jgi:hypothetical protein
LPGGIERIIRRKARSRCSFGRSPSRMNFRFACSVESWSNITFFWGGFRRDFGSVLIGFLRGEIGLRTDLHRLLPGREDGPWHRGPRKTGQLSGRADDPVTGHDDRNRISTVRRSDSSCGCGISELPGHVAIRPRIAKRYAQQSLPYVLLKRSSSHIERY